MVKVKADELRSEYPLIISSSKSLEEVNNIINEDYKGVDLIAAKNELLEVPKTKTNKKIDELTSKQRNLLKMIYSYLDKDNIEDIDVDDFLKNSAGLKNSNDIKNMLKKKYKINVDEFDELYKEKENRDKSIMRY